MPTFSAFRGLRYDQQRVSLDDVIAPPYDIVGPEARERLAARSPYNSILVELPLPDAQEGLDAYQHAAALLAAWERDGTLRRDESPALYGYRMTRRHDGAVVSSTTGVIGAMTVDPEGKTVLPHEQTMAKDTRDRFELLRACRANLSPIWGLSLAKGLSSFCSDAIEAAIDHRSAVDDEGTTHEIWAITDQSAIDQISSLIGAEPVVIADGHHRYETALRYRSTCRAENGDHPGDYDAIMALIVELSADELAVEPIHRLVTDLPPDVDLVGELSRAVEVVPGPDDPDALTSAMRSSDALGLVTPQGSYLLVDHQDDGTGRPGLDSARVGELLQELPTHTVTYQASAKEVVDAVRSGRAQAAILLKPASVDQIADAAYRRTSMPPKTTYFAPKPRTGMVFRPLDV